MAITNGHLAELGLFDIAELATGVLPESFYHLSLSLFTLIFSRDHAPLSIFYRHLGIKYHHLTSPENNLSLQAGHLPSR